MLTGGGTVGFPDPDFLGAALSHKGGQSKEPQAGDKYGNGCKYIEQGPCLLFILVHLIIMLIQQFIIKRDLTYLLLPLLLQEF